MDDNDITWGTPTLTEIKEYFAAPCLNINEREVMENGVSSAESLDLNDSFRTLLAERRRKAEEELAKLNLKTPTTAKKTLLDKTWTPFAGRLDETEVDRSDWEPSDETFARMEEMCENTEETEALERLLDQVEVTPQRNKKKILSVDMTQINDIEAPSCMWEQTIMHANSPKPSPIKMVGLLRPSTIIEESTSSETTISTVKSRIMTETVVIEEESVEESVEEESVVSVDSTGESFSTARADVTEAKYCTAAETTSSTAASTSSTSDSFPTTKRKFFRDSMFSLGKVKSERQGKSENYLDSLDVVEVSDDSLLESSITDENQEPNLDDTFEKMNYLLAQADKMNVGKKPFQSLQPNISPKPKPSSPQVLAAPFKPSPSKGAFKKPIPGVRPLTATKNKFSHIASPISNYIHNTAQHPPIQRHKSSRDPRLASDDVFDTRKLRETQYSLKPPSPKLVESLPHKATIAATAQKYYDARTPQKIPGGEKIKQLIGQNTPTVVKHEGRLKMAEQKVMLNGNDTVDQSFADLSLMSGDVSVCVVKNLKRI